MLANAILLRNKQLDNQNRLYWGIKWYKESPSFKNFTYSSDKAVKFSSDSTGNLFKWLLSRFLKNKNSFKGKFNSSYSNLSKKNQCKKQNWPDTYKCVRFDFIEEKDSGLTLDILLFDKDLNEDIIRFVSKKRSLCSSFT